MVMALLVSTGFVTLAAAGTGAVLGIDGIAAMIPLAWLWVPLLAIATRTPVRCGVGDHPR